MDPFVTSFETLTAACPQKLAVAEHHAVTTRAQLLQRARSRADQLSSEGITNDSVVTFCADRGVEFLAGWLALRILGARPILADAMSARMELRALSNRMHATHTWRVETSGGDVLTGIEREQQRECLVVDETSTILLTSGSTGEPLGVEVSAAQLEADGRQLASSMQLRDDDRYLCVLPFSHAYGFSLLPTTLFLFGSTLVVPDPSNPFASAAKHAATVLPAVPAWFRAHVGAGATGTGIPASLRLFISAGSPLPAELARQWRELCGRPIRVFYGCTECGGISFDRTGDAAERGFVGTPVDGVELEIIEPLNGDGSGTIRVRSAAVAKRYLPQSDGRAGLDGAGGFTTDDLGRLVDGELRLCGRRSGWIDVNGKKVNPREVESIISEMPGVADVEVFGKPAPPGRGEIVRAAIVRSDAALEYSDVVRWCRERLASHKAPRSIAFVEQLARTPRGKIDMCRLREL